MKCSCGKLADVITSIEIDWTILLSTKQVARRLGIHRSTVYEWVLLGWLPARRIGRSLMIPGSVIEALDCTTCERPCLDRDLITCQ